MNITEFAEQIVFGKTLEDKLLKPGKLSHDGDFSLRANVNNLASPGRPHGLEMRHDKGGNVQPPSDSQLENEQARGQLLHFLANHELLATELMALVLLKFPDAPRAFRQGILVTLQEEQEHTRMYIRRMKECGVEFGRYPLSGQFWRVIEPMQSPMDFVSRLSLTFEQANLDYSLHFAKVFNQIGDTETSALLQQIYEDEIGHVQHGLHWFRQWKDPQQTDWQAYQESLDFPMSPQRGRGPRGAFNREGRIRAGLSESFVDAIEVFRQSRGRTPVVRWFDPAAEAELAREPSDTLTDQLGRDLELVMVVMSKQDDVVVVRRQPSREIRMHMIEAGFDLPEFVEFDDRELLSERKLKSFSPWAWTPKNHDVVRPLLDSTRIRPLPWSDRSADLYRKSWAAEKLRTWQTESQTFDWFTSVDCAGSQVHSEADVVEALKELDAKGFQSAIFKTDLGASGRGQRRLNCGQPLSLEDKQWLKAKLAVGDNPKGVVEPELKRVVDLSLLWRLKREEGSAETELVFQGWTRPLITDGRRYCGTRLGTALDGCDSRVKQFLLADRCEKINSLVEWLQERITPELRSRGFSGYFGVDAFVCKDADQNLKIKPLVELNPRMTMGHIALSLDKRLEPGVEAEFRIFSKSQWSKIENKLASFPFAKSGSARWKSGLIRLGEVDDQTKLVPVLLVGIDAIAVAHS